jgi:hypothetical protein
MMRGRIVGAALLGAALLCAGCKKAEVQSGVQAVVQSGVSYSYTKNAQEVARWTSMVTPGGGEGSVSSGSNVAIIKAAPDGWGGVQSEKITLDLSKEPVLLVQVRENADGFKWGAKFVPSTPAVEDHAWGFYLIEDNNFKWNNYAGVDLRAKLGQDFIGLYSEKVEGVIWLYATGSPEATVEITSVKMFNQK